ncbi:hypothetical protein [Micromonospora zhanjiangensis]
MWRRWGRWCSCGFRWRSCPDRYAAVPTTRSGNLPPYWGRATTDEFTQLERARVWRRNQGRW